MFNRSLALAAVLMLGAVAVAQPAVSPFEILPGDSVSAAAPGHQTAPVAVKGGEHTLVVWFDPRDIHAIRINAQGNHVDDEPIIIARDRIDNNAGLPRPPTPPPSVAWNGQHWFIAYRGQTVSANGLYITTYVFGVRMAPDGTIVDSTPITIRRSEDIGNDLPGPPSVAAGPDGTWVVAWSEYAGPYLSLVKAHRISAGGELLTAEPLTLSSTTEFSDATDPRIVGGRTGFLLTMRFGTRYGSDHDAYGRRYDAQMNPLAPFFNVGSGDPQRYTATSLAASPEEWLIVGVANNGGLYGFRVPLESAAPVNAAGISLAPAPVSDASAAFDGGNWAVGYIYDLPNSTGTRLRVRRFTPALAAVDPQPLSVPIVPGYDEAFTYNVVTAGQLPGGGVVVLWHDDAVPADYNVWLTRVLPGDPPEVRQLLSGELPTQSVGGVATRADGSGAVALWSSTAERRAILVQRFGPDGEIIDAEPITVATATFGQAAGVPDIVFNGSVYFIVWPAGSRAVARRMTPDGTFLDPEPVPVLPINETSVVTMLGVSVAAIDDIVLVTGYSRQSFNRPYVRYARVRASDMTVLDPNAPILELSINQLGGFSTPVVAAVGPAGAQRFLVAFTDSPPAGEDNVDIALVGTDGVSTAAGSIGSPGSALPTAAAIGDRALVVYRNAGADGVDLFGRIFTSDGMAETPEMLILSAPGTQTNPRLATDGEGYLLAWSDFRHEVGQGPLEPSFSDPWAARLDTNGASLDGTGFPLRASLTSELGLCLAPLGLGRYIAFYRALTPEVPAVYRAGRQTIDGSGGPACPPDWDGNETVNSGDISAFLTSWLASVQGGSLGADFNGDLAVDSSDISAFLTAWLGAVQDGC